jgi:anti-sigma factor RsiW
MKWFWNPCRRVRREICLLAAGALSERDRPELERHLAACSGCRNYCNEIKALTAPLAGWEKNFAHLEPTQAMQEGWAGAVQASGGIPARHEPLLKTIWRNVWRELIWPCRRAWVGLAALWLVLLAINARLSDHPMQLAGGRSSSAAAMMQSWQEETRILAELTQPGVVYAPVNAPAAPSNPARPRSERKQDWQIV